MPSTRDINSGMGYIVDMEESDTGISGIYLNIEPDSITDDKSPNYADTSPMARSAPLKAYVDTGSRTVSFSCIIAALDGNAADVKRRVQYLKSFLYPDYTTKDPYILPPHRVYFKYGASVSIVGVVTSASVTWSTVNDSSNYSIWAKVSVSIAEIRDNNLIDYLEARFDDGKLNSQSSGYGDFR